MNRFINFTFRIILCFVTRYPTDQRHTHDHVIVRQGDPNYNAGLDTGGKGYITAGDLTLQLQRAAGRYKDWTPVYNSIVALLPTRRTAVALAELVGISIAGAVLGAAGFLMYKRFA